MYFPESVHLRVGGTVSLLVKHLFFHGKTLKVNKSQIKAVANVQFVSKTFYINERDSVLFKNHSLMLFDSPNNTIVKLNIVMNISLKKCFCTHFIKCKRISQHKPLTITDVTLNLLVLGKKTF